MAAQTISIPALPDVGAGLQIGAFNATLSTGQHGGVTVHIESDSAVALVSRLAATPGTASIDVVVPNGGTSALFYVHGLDGTTGTATITASATGFTSGTRMVTVVQPALDISGLASSVDLFANPEPFQVRVGLPNAGATAVFPIQSVRAGGGLTATVVNSNALVGELEKTATSGQTVTVSIAAGSTSSPGSVATGGIAFDGLALGGTTVSASIPGFIATVAASQSVTVIQPSLSMAAISNVGAGLQGSANNITLSGSQHGGVTVHVETDTPSLALVSPASSTPGSPFIDVFVPNGTSTASFLVHGLENTTGTASISASATGFTGAGRLATIVQPALDISGLASPIDTLDPSDPFAVRVGIPNAGNTAVGTQQFVRAGGGLTASINNSNATVGELETTAFTGSPVTVQIAPGQSQSPGSVATGGVAFDGLALGTTTVSATIPGFIATTAATQPVTVTQPNLAMTSISNVGAGLMGSANSVTLSASQHGGVTVHIESDSAVALVSPLTATPGAGAIDVFVPNGGTTAFFYVHGLENATGSATITTSATGFTGASRLATIVQPALDISGLTTPIDTLAPSDPFAVRVGIPVAGNAGLAGTQFVRAGSPGLTATLTNSNGAVGELETTAFTGSPVTVQIAAGQSQSPGSVATGGVAFDGLALGTTSVSATIPGFIATTAATQSVTVTQPNLAMTSISNIGSGLMGSANSVTLSASQHGGVTVHIESDNASLALVSPLTTTLGEGAFDVFVPNGSTTAFFYVHGLENTTGSATITASAPGFTGANRLAAIVQPALDISGLTTTIDTLAPSDPFAVRVGIPVAGNAGLAGTQFVRAGSPGLTATLTNSNGAVGELETTAFTGSPVTVQIAAGQSQSAGSVAAGGVAFDGLALGTTSVSATIPGFIATTAATQSVTVTQPTLSMGAISNVGSGLMGSANSVSLSVSQHGGVTVHIESDSAVALVSPLTSTPGSPSIDVFLANGNTTAFFYVHGLENTTGSATIIASAPGFIGTNRPVTIVQPALDISGLASSMDVLDPDDAFVVRVGIPTGGNTAVSGTQLVRAGSPGLTATLTSSNTSVGRLVTTAGSGSPVTVSIAAGQSQSPGTVAAGGVAFDGLSVGATLVAAAIPGFIPTGAATQAVQVTQLIVTMGSIDAVGAGLQSGAHTASLGFAQHGGVTMRVESSDPLLALVSPAFATPGSAYFDTVLPNGSTTVTFFVQGLAGVTGTSTITASAPGFTSASRPANVVQPAVQIGEIAGTIDVAASPDPFILRVGVPALDGSAVETPQVVRAGGAALVATVSSSLPTVGALNTTTETGSPVTVGIPVGQSQSAASVGAGGVELDPLAAGTTVVSVAIAGFLATDAASQSVTVVGLANSVSIDDVTVSEGDSGTINAVFTVTQAVPDPTVSVDFATSSASALAPSDYAAASGTLSFASGPTQQIVVAVAGDLADEPNEAFLVTLANPTPGTVLARPQGQATILDDDGRPALCKPIAAVPFTILVSDNYCLVRNLAYPSDTGAAITIEADGVQLDFKGFSLDGTGAGLGTQAYGVYSLDRSDIAILNGGVRGFLAGLWLDEQLANPSGYVVRGMRLDQNTRAGIWLEGRGSVVRNNLVLDTGGTTAQGANAEAYGIVVQGEAARVIENDVVKTTATGTGAAFGIRLLAAHRSFVERNRVGNAAALSGQKGISIESSSDVLLVQNRLHQLDAGSVFTASSGKYRGNLSTGCAAPYSGGTDAGNNQ